MDGGAGATSSTLRGEDRRVLLVEGWWEWLEEGALAVSSLAGGGGGALWVAALSTLDVEAVDPCE